MSNGFVVAYTVTDGGSGYSEPPVVTLVGGGGAGAKALAIVTSGVVIRVDAVAAGSGYVEPPAVVVSAPMNEPRVLGMQMIPLVTLRGVPGDTNLIETTTTMKPGAVWIPLTTVVLTNTTQEWYDRVSPPGVWRCYRSVILGEGNPAPGVRFVWLPAGRFVMGSPTDEQGRGNDESPQTQVTFTHGFYIGRYEVTQGEYLSVIGNNPSSFTGDTNRPVEQVSWDDATNYCARLTQREQESGRLSLGWVYRLPTEAEWEFACRAGTTNRFFFGDDAGYTQLTNYAWYAANSDSTTHTTGLKPSNPWGLYDTSGNVWEWCSDWYAWALPGLSVTDPQGPANGSNRVLRGGGYYASDRYCRSAARYSDSPSRKLRIIGFRVVLAPVP